MNCPSRSDADIPNGWNQNPNAFALDTNNGSNGIVNLRSLRDHRIPTQLPLGLDPPISAPSQDARPLAKKTYSIGYSERSVDEMDQGQDAAAAGAAAAAYPDVAGRRTPWLRRALNPVMSAGRMVKKFGRFVGPGFMVAVAYIDPGNYATDVAAGATYKYKLLVMVLFSNIIAIFLQSLCVKLGSVTGMNLAENIKAHFPPWLNYLLWFFAEAAIIATDIAEVIGTAIALNLLLKIPLVAGCAISIADVLIILIFYRPSGSMRGLRIFEYGVMALVLGVVVCFCIELSLIRVGNVGSLFRGFLPSSALVQSQGLFQACGILGATVMPHSLYLGSGLVQPRLLEYDRAHGRLPSSSLPSPSASASASTDSLAAVAPAAPAAPSARTKPARPSLAAIRHCLSFSIAELALSLFTFALFVNSAILVVAGASLSALPDPGAASLFDIHALLAASVGPAAGTVFALALLLSGTSAGIVATIAGQMVSEGQLDLHVAPWLRRLLTRCISITPSIVIAAAVGRAGLSAALEGTQVALSVMLPFTSAPLIYFTCRERFMCVEDEAVDGGGAGLGAVRKVSFRNNWVTAGFAIALWLLICVMNVAALVLTGRGES